MPEPRELQTLPVLLGSLGMTKPKLVIAQGLEYWRIEDALAQARRMAKSGSPVDQAALKEPIYWSDTDEDGRVLIMREGPDGPQVVAAEVGSRHVPPPVVRP